VKTMRTLKLRWQSIVLTLAMSACTSTPDKPALVTQSPTLPTSPVAAPSPTPATIGGYLVQASMPRSALLVPAPPTANSAAMALDEETNRSALAMNGTPRWELATHDAVLTFPAMANTFSCALNLPISEEHTPKLIKLLRRTLADAGRATSEAKQLYARTRPFVINGKPTCTPDREPGLRRDGSYPSGHSSIGWALGLVLSEVAPDRTNELVVRGHEFGQSRLVCNVHWQSDVQAGRVVASAVFARLNAEAAFRDDVAAARAEVEAIRAQGLAASGCEAEAQAIKSWK